MPKNSLRIPELDGFRGLAILLVLVGHTLTFSLHVAPYASLKMAEVGVLLFFVLSGYLITGLLRDEARRTGSISLKAFYLRRARRLLPALTVFLAVIALLRAAGLVTDVSNKDFLAAVFYIRNIFGSSESLNHLWSLSLEEQFYTLWPLLFLLLGQKRMLSVAVGLTVAVMAWRGIAVAFHLWDYRTGVFYMRPWFRFDAIAIGCCLAMLRLPRSPKPVFAIASAGLVLWSLFGERISQSMLITGQTVLAGAALFSVIKGGTYVRSLFSMGWLRWLGRISYSLYLWQQIFTVSWPKIGPLRDFPLNIILVVLLAFLSRRFVEEVFLSSNRKHHDEHSQRDVRPQLVRT